MTTGELFLKSLSSGVITQAEINWLLSQQDHFARTEQAAMQRLGRLLDQGQLQALNEWTEPLGPRDRSSLALAA
jgi:hypothetical protein